MCACRQNYIAYAMAPNFVLLKPLCKKKFCKVLAQMHSVWHFLLMSPFLNMYSSFIQNLQFIIQIPLQFKYFYHNAVPFERILVTSRMELCALLVQVTFVSMHIVKKLILQQLPLEAANIFSKFR